MTAIHKLKSTLGFTDPALAADENADAKDIDENAVKSHEAGEPILENFRQALDKRGGVERCGKRGCPALRLPCEAPVGSEVRG